MNYSLIILASAVLRFLVIHTAKRHSREGRHSREDRHSREGGSLLCALERSKGKARTETSPQNVFLNGFFGT